MKFWRRQSTTVNIGAFLVCLFVLRVCSITSQALSYDQFLAIQCGQTLSDVEAVLGQKGRIQGTSTFPDGFGGEYSSQSFLFGDDYGSYIDVTFIDGGVFSKLGSQLIGAPHSESHSVNCP